jgi:hypothetical protein
MKGSPMFSLKQILPWIGSASMAFTLAACGGSETPVSATSDAPAEKETLYFSETFSDSGVFEIHQVASGIFSYSIQARIGSLAENRMNSVGKETTLAEIYRALKGKDGVIPAAVEKASERLKVQQADRIPLPAQAEQTPLAKAASQSDFKTNYCKDIRENSWVWHWQSCDWTPSSNSIWTPFVDARADGTIDRVYAYNVTPYTATLELWDTWETKLVSTWKPTLKPYWVTWFQWGGRYSFAIAKMILPAGKVGELGLSTHTPIPYVK